MTNPVAAAPAGPPESPAGPVPANETQAELLAVLRLLAEQIGPRPSAGDGERTAAAFMIDRLRRAGYEVALEPFDGLKTFSWTYAPLYGLLALAGFLSRRLPGLATLVSLGTFAAFLAETLGFEVVSRLPLLPRGRSQNVVAHLPLPEDAAEPACRVVLVAHLDSSRAALAFHPRLVGNFRRSFLTWTLAMAIVALGSLFGWLRPVRRRPVRLDGVLKAAAATLLIPLGTLLHREAAMPVVPGANDNASGAAVLLVAAERLAARLRGRRDRTAEVWVVFTGCEESGLGGMQRFLEAYRDELDPATTLFLNVDTVGGGTLTLVTQEGMLWPLLADGELLDAATHLAIRRGLHYQTHAFRTMPTDALVPLARGYRALSLMALDEQGRLPNWHWPSDTWDAVDLTTMEAALSLLVPLVRRLAAGPGQRIG
ncbi:MAG TPA: M28 family peptidase [Chloroflexia bacterium]|nr:M28 family peptidase [Chloroflexia bacterium]